MSKSMSQLISLDRFLGCLLGQAVGDALGAPFEGLPADFIYWTEGPVHELLAQPSTEILRYTDDTQMMIGGADTIVTSGERRQDAPSQRCGATEHLQLGYGPVARGAS